MRCLMRVNFAARLPYEIILYPIVARGTHACAENIKSWLELARDQPLPELRLCGVSRDRKRVMGQVVGAQRPEPPLAFAIILRQTDG